MLLKEILKKLLPISLLEYYWNYKRKSKTYYGRNKVDKIILKYLNFDNGFFVELGANDGIKESNTYYFEKNLNWKGILIEPSIENYEKCKKNRSKEKLGDLYDVKDFHHEVLKRGAIPLYMLEENIDSWIEDTLNL